MLDEFELRLADVIADELSGVTALQLVTRPRADLADTATDPARVAIVVHTLNAESSPIMGDDALERRGTKGQFQLRTTIRLRGQVAADVAIRTSGGDQVPARRRMMVQVMDALLVAMQSESFRTGRAFLTDEDQGFELDGFRLAGFAEFGESAGSFALPPGFGAMRVTYDFSGRFWPVEPLVEGDTITGLPTRIAVMPPLIPERLHTTAGASDLNVPVGLDLRVLSGAEARVIARLRGASPPGALIGDTAGAPPGWTVYTPAPDGRIAVVYRPPAELDSPARVRVALALHRESRPSIPLGDFAIEVTTA